MSDSNIEVLTFEPQSDFSKDLYRSIQEAANKHDKTPKDAFVQIVGLFKMMYKLDATQGKIVYLDSDLENFQ